MERYVYIKERRNGARREKTIYRAIEFWAKASGAVLETVPIGKTKSLTTEAWRLPDGRIVDAVLISDEEVQSREFMERLAEELVRDSSPDNLRRLEKTLRDRNKD